MPGCTVPNCSNSSQKGFRLYHFPRDVERNRIWVRNCGRGGDWKATRHTCICEVHFEESQFESHRADGLRKLRPYAVPTVFNRQGPKKVGRSRKLLKVLDSAAEQEPQIKIKSEKTSPAEERLSDPLSTGGMKGSAKLAFAQPLPSTGSAPVSVLPKRKSARISVRGRRIWTNLYKGGAEAPVMQTTRGEAEGECLSKQMHVVVERIDVPTEVRVRRDLKRRSATGETAVHAVPVKKSAALSVGGGNKWAPVDADEEVEEIQEVAGDESPQHPDAGVLESKVSCFVCNKLVEGGTPLNSLTPTTKIHFHQKLARLVVEEDGLAVEEDGVLCSLCTRLLNYMDRIEVELTMLKKAILNCMRRKHSLQQRTADKEQPSNDEIQHDSTGDMEDELAYQDFREKGEDSEELASHWKEADEDTEEDADDPDPVDEPHTNVTSEPPTPKDEALSDVILEPPQDEGRPDSASEQQSPWEHELKQEQEEDDEDGGEQSSPHVPEFQCSICTFKTVYKSVIIFHLRQHVKENFRCDFCNVSIPQNSKFVSSIGRYSAHTHACGTVLNTRTTQSCSDMDEDGDDAAKIEIAMSTGNAGNVNSTLTRKSTINVGDVDTRTKSLTPRIGDALQTRREIPLCTAGNGIDTATKGAGSATTSAS